MFSKDLESFNFVLFCFKPNHFRKLYHCEGMSVLYWFRMFFQLINLLIHLLMQLINIWKWYCTYDVIICIIKKFWDFQGENKVLIICNNSVLLLNFLEVPHLFEKQRDKQKLAFYLSGPHLKREQSVQPIYPVWAQVLPILFLIDLTWMHRTPSQSCAWLNG